MSLAEWLPVAAICALGAMSPGPSLAVVLHHAARGSRPAGASCALAHAAGVGLYAFVTALGLAAFLARHPDLYRAIVLAGAAYLAWLGARLLRGGDGAGPTGAERPASGWPAAARDGFLTALLNPKIALFFLALFSQFVGPEPGAVTVALLTATATVIDAGWYLAVGAAVGATALPVRLRQHVRLHDRVMGSVLLLVAGWVLLSSW